MEQITITAKFIRLVFPKERPSDMEFRICHFLVIKGASPITSGQTIAIKGYGFPAEVRGTPTFKITGKIQKDDRYGYSIEAYSCEYEIEETKEGMIAFLSSGQIRGIGPATAKKIVDLFGDETMKILNEQVDRLIEVPSISAAKLSRIKESLAKQDKIVTKLISRLSPYGITPNLCIKIRQFYDSEALTILEENPYDLCSHIRGVGFIIADRIAMAWGHSPNDPNRLSEVVMYALERAESSGHSCLMLQDLFEFTLKMMGDVSPRICASQAQIMDTIHALINSKRIIKYQDWYYRKHTELAEANIASICNNLLSKEPLRIKDVEIKLERAKEKLSLNLGKEQVMAVKTSLSSPLSIITGGPGTGKTTIIRTIVEVAFMQNNATRIVLLAPTGKAARRIEESTKEKASTIHSALSIRDHEDTFAQIEADLVIVDESSMIDIFLASKLLQACEGVNSIIFVGDVDQLPSVGCGNFLSDLINCKGVPVTRLIEVYRQKEKSTIPVNAAKVKQGLTDFIKDPSSFIIHDDTDPEIVLRMLVRAYVECYNKYGREKACVILPMKKGKVSTESVNRMIQQAINPSKGELEYTKKERGKKGSPPVEKEIIRSGDTVMATKNGPQLCYSNGDTGTVTKIFRDEDNELVVEVKFDSGYVHGFTHDNLEHITLAYAITVHKSQGCEYDIIISSLLPQHYIMLRRNLIYTAMTRAKEKFVFVGSLKSFNKAVHEIGDSRRFSNLANRIHKLP